MLILIKDLETKKQNSLQKNATDAILQFVSTKHIKECKALKAQCSNCNKIGHFAKVCQQKNVNCVDSTDSGNNRNGHIPVLQLERSTVKQSPKFTVVKSDFKKNLLINNRSIKTLINAGAIMSVCREQQAKLRKSYDKTKPSFAKLHPVLLYQ